MQGTQYATKRSILCRGAFCGPTVRFLCQIHTVFKMSLLLSKIHNKTLNINQTLNGNRPVIHSHYNYGIREG